MRIKYRLAVREGRVSCPSRHASVDVEQCLSCLALNRVRGGSLRTGSIVCKPDMGSAALGTHPPDSWPLGLFPTGPAGRR